MRRIIIESIRRKGSQKRGGGRRRTELNGIELEGLTGDDQILAVNQALDRLEESNPEAAKLVKLRFFGGLTLAETALAMGLAERTAKRRWAFARAWLYREIRRE